MAQRPSQIRPPGRYDGRETPIASILAHGLVPVRSAIGSSNLFRGPFRVRQSRKCGFRPFYQRARTERTALAGSDADDGGAAVAATVLALGGAAWYARRRWGW